MTDQTTDHLSEGQARCTCEACPHPWKDPRCAIHTTPEDRAFFDFAQAFFGRWEDGPGEDTERLWEADLRPAFDKAAATLATYYEDKGRAALSAAEEKRNAEERNLRQTFQRLYDEKIRELAAAEEKGRSEERERLRKLADQQLNGLLNVANAHYYGGEPERIQQVTDAIEEVRASLDSDQEGS